MLTKNWAAQPLFWPVRSVGGYLRSLRTFRKVGSHRTRSEGRRASHGSNVNRITSRMPLTPPGNVHIGTKACCTWVLSEFPSRRCGSSVTMNGPVGPLSVFGMVFNFSWMYRTNALDAGCGSDGFGACCRLIKQSCIHSSSFPFWPFQYAAKDLATICWFGCIWIPVARLHLNSCCSPQTATRFCNTCSCRPRFLCPVLFHVHKKHPKALVGALDVAVATFLWSKIPKIVTDL